jgi:hypothetical protein
MENNFFNQVGKKIPYTTPEDFFNRSEKELRAIANHKFEIINHKLPTVNRRWYYAIAASIVLVIGIFGIVRFFSPAATQTDASYYSQTYDNSADWSDFADADIFWDNID